MDKVQEENVSKYRKYGLNGSNIRRYTCVVCNENTSIDESFSNQGRNLICTRCANSKFKSAYDLFDWLNRKE